ncbi:MAG: DUF4105 domain-containing protein [Desulfobulbaceae bacterium]|nr:DUF4105 domain-containing protein [Desulfobulbaceae bacterium]
MWRALLHMGRSSADESRIDSPKFFLSPEGSHNPAAEGGLTLNSFFQPVEPGREGEHPQCLYPARYSWLNEQLSFDSDLLPEQSCSDLRQWLEAMDPDGITMVFPESYLNNPASMFGHTLLRVEQKNGRSPLLAPSINFAAVTDEKPGIGYALKGLFGGYPGRFSIGLYADQVRAYGALENRDIYEYHLGLSAEETRFLLLHVRELQRATFDYFFIDENCSYQLLALLEVGRPSLDVINKMPFAAVPVDTIRLLTAVPGMLQGVHYRPSRRTVLQGRTVKFSRVQKKIVRSFAVQGQPADRILWNSWNSAEQAEILDAAIDLFLYDQAVAIGKNDARAPVFQHLLALRNRLNVDPSPDDFSSPVRPDQGHGTGRAAVGLGSDDGIFFVELGLRPVLHDLMDPGPGYVNGAGIDFLSLRLRYYPEQDQLKVQSVDLLNIVSLAPVDQLVRPISWTARIGLDQMRYAGAGDRLTGRAMAGFGLSMEITDVVSGYGLLTGELLAKDRFEDGLNTILGTVAGLRSGLDWWNCIFQARAGYAFFYRDQWLWSLDFIQALDIATDFSLRLRVTREQEFAGPTTETMFSLLWYF